MRRIFFPALMLFLIAGTKAQEPERSPIILNHANSLHSMEENGVQRQELKGDIFMTRDSLTIRCQNAVYYPDSGLAIFRDNVEFRDPHRILMADEVVYNEFTEEVRASNRVRIYQHDTLSATSRSAKYLDRLQQGYLYDDVQLREEHRRLLLEGMQGFVDHEKQYGRVTGNPVLTERDSSMNIVTVIHGDTVEYFGDSKLARVLHHVRVERDSLVAKGDRLDYYSGDHMAVLTGTPEAVRGSDVIRGDTMRLFFEKEELSRMEILGHAVTTSPADSGQPEPLNRMEGKVMTLWVEKSVVTRALIEGTAIATYYVRDQGRKRGKNVTSGDQIQIFFEDRKMSRIQVEGGTEGTYTPERLLPKPS